MTVGYTKCEFICAAVMAVTTIEAASGRSDDDRAYRKAIDA
jgi:hypothetical protein